MLKGLPHQGSGAGLNPAALLAHELHVQHRGWIKGNVPFGHQGESLVEGLLQRLFEQRPDSHRQRVRAPHGLQAQYIIKSAHGELALKALASKRMSWHLK